MCARISFRASLVNLQNLLSRSPLRRVAQPAPPSDLQPQPAPHVPAPSDARVLVGHARAPGRLLPGHHREERAAHAPGLRGAGVRRVVPVRPVHFAHVSTVEVIL